MYSRTRGYLPHIIHPQGQYFLTIRLADSLPASVVISWRDELELKRKVFRSSDELANLSHEYQAKIQEYLDTSVGHCWLSNPDVARVVDDALRFYDQQRYRLLVWTIMPNHVHVLLELTGSSALSSIVQTWKSFTAHKANRILKRTGEFWQREYFDRLITSNRQTEFVLRYILNNPVKAGLCNSVYEWRWNRCSAELQILADRFFRWKDSGEAGEDAGGH